VTQLETREREGEREGGRGVVIEMSFDYSSGERVRADQTGEHQNSHWTQQ